MLLIHKVEVSDGVIDRVIKDEFCRNYRYIASINEPVVGDRVNKYFSYDTIKECLEVVKNYNQV